MRVNSLFIPGSWWRKPKGSMYEIYCQCDFILFFNLHLSFYLKRFKCQIYSTGFSLEKKNHLAESWQHLLQNNKCFSLKYRRKCLE